MTNSPRQFWLANVPPLESVFDFFETQVSRIYSGDMDFKNAVHVLEYTAYNQAVYELDKSRASHVQKIERLQAQLDEAVKCLELITHPNMNPAGVAYGAIELARTTLASLRKGK